MTNKKTGKVIVFITGLPGTGKSYAARKIRETYPQFREVSYDQIKEIFWDILGFDSQEEKVAINDRSLEYFYLFLDRQMKTGDPLIAEYPFFQRKKDALAEVVERNGYKALTVCLYGDLDVIYQRQKRRDENDIRHPGHLGDRYHLEEFDKYLNGPHYDYTKEEFWNLHKHKDYHIHLGKEFDIDVTDLNSISYDEVLEEIGKLFAE